MSEINKVDYDDLQDMVASNDAGGRNPYGFTKKLIIVTAILWSVFQLYYSSPLAYTLQEMVRAAGIDINVVIDDTKARSIHLSFALFLGFLTFPAFATSPKHKVPLIDWTFAIVGAFLASYYLFFYEGLVTRFGAPNLQDIIAGCMGIILLLEATRRTLGLPLVIIAAGFLLYNYFGQFFPSSWIVSHRTGTLSHIINQQWITPEGVFGVALGVSTKYVFLFVLFGALLDKAGAGNYFIKTAFAYLGHLRGGPAKAAVVASGLTGLISGSSIANVVTTGTFTIPMMKRVGFSSEKAGAVEVASSVNGQIMPPVMGAAAFLMIEYVNMPYSELITHAFLPALISYIALVYIVHLEACKLNLTGLQRTDPARPLFVAIIRVLATFLSVCILYFAVKFGLGWIKEIAPNSAFMIIMVLLTLAYLGLIYRVAQFPELEIDDPTSKIVKLPSVKPTVNSGLHFLLPVVVLIWCLMIERLSPGLSAFWGTLVLSFILVTQRTLLNFFRKEVFNPLSLKLGVKDLIDGLETGARNMIGIGIATATAGIIVGVVSLTGFGVQLSGIIEALSMGSVLIMLVLVAVFSLILGMGLPTTANYVVVSSLMATVIVEVGRQNGLIVPLIAVHLFVFYFGIMADVTPPVGLASFAAAAVSGGNPIKTGLVAFFYSLRTAILPFLFIFNTDLLLINVGWAKGILVFIISTTAILLFTAATMNFFITKNKKWETVALILSAFILFRPALFMEQISPSTKTIEATQFVQQLENASAGEKITLQIAGVNPYGKPIEFFSELDIPDVNGQTRLKALGLELLEQENKVIVDMVDVGSPAEKAGLSWDQVILSVKLPQASLPKELMFIPALLLALFVGWNQRRRRKNAVATN
ncbi:MULTISPECIES: TRAP transporter permease [Pasteurellaceae]|uniref:TRAP transporter permease n=1 Tax=Pasteurella atlantica TaxID=2827233 RepID=A0AAW8CNU4_9PAST|nr:TRAP transporter permease [Pasteurella atlantica]MBR0573131.1 TRAP transporter permease [Pasteurella atlantica]MDP8039012.1 TRAP transporter permease [Pasteurella atlantica]MDP8041102.1 TRAP transporter permease [Pasteurella atlantica]MDP8043285.1 TRAP transporter permease [Pasteurella atlantica]MDP8045371.1 TRAP transporter permease [Pasteurella atlantica]